MKHLVSNNFQSQSKDTDHLALNYGYFSDIILPELNRFMLKVILHQLSGTLLQICWVISSNLLDNLFLSKN